MATYTCLELLSIYVRNDSDIHGINYGESEVKLLLYADDITATLSSQGDNVYWHALKNLANVQDSR